MVRELIHLRAHFLSGWAIVVEPSLESEVIHGGETLWLHDDEKQREIFLSSMVFTRHDGEPWECDDILSVFPPPELSGYHYRHALGELKSRALWYYGDSDTSPAWVLAAAVANARESRLLRCTIVCTHRRDHRWALKAWKSISYPGEGTYESLVSMAARPRDPSARS